MNFSLYKLVKNLSDEDFKYLVEEFGSENLQFLKQKDAYTYDYMNNFKYYLTCEKIWDKFYIKDMGDYHNHI